MSDSAHATNGSASAVDVTETVGEEGGGSADEEIESAADEKGESVANGGDGGAYTFDDLSVVMGTYNEAEAIGTVLDDIDEVTDGRAEVVCVDGSDDRTPEIAREHGARVIEQEPQGYGVAVREAILTPDRPVVVTTDCDDTYPMEALPEFLAEVNDGADVVSGDRLYHGAEAMPAFNRFGNHAFAAVASLLIGGILSFAVSTFRRSIPFQYGVWGAEFGTKVIAVNTGLKLVFISFTVALLLAPVW